MSELGARNFDRQLVLPEGWFSLSALHTLRKVGRFYCVTSHLMEKMSKLHSFDWRYRKPPKCHFQSYFTQRPAQFTQGIPQFPQFTCPTPRWHHLKAHPFLAIHSADKHHTIYSVSNTTSYSTFYVFFSSFRYNIMADVASKQQTTALFLSTTVTRTHTHTHTHTHTQEDTQN